MGLIERRIELCFFLCLLMISCNQNSTVDSNLFKDVLQVSEDSAYIYNIDNSKDTLLNTKDGLVFCLPKNCLTNKDGSEISEKVLIELNVYRSIANILAEGLQTISEDNLLISDGMFDVQGQTVSGKDVLINKENPIRLIASLQSNENGMMLFEEAKLNSSNWVLPKRSTGNPLVIPFDVIWENDVNRITISNVAETDSRILEFYRVECNEMPLGTFKLLEYQHSFIATNEFWDRYWSDYGSNRDRINGHDFVHTPWLSNDNQNLIEMYTHMPIWKVDSIILEELKTNLDEFRNDSMSRRSEKKQSIISRSDMCSTPKCMEKLMQGYLDWEKTIIVSWLEYIQVWEQFKKQKFTYIDSSFLPPIDTNSIMAIQDVLETSKELKLRTKKLYKYIGSLSSTVSFKVFEFGRYNIDEYYPQEDLFKTELTVRTNEIAPSVRLVFKNVKATISPSVNHEDSQMFNSKLPKEIAYLIAVSFKNNQLLFAKKEIQIGQNEVEKLELKPSSQEEISKVLEDIEKGYE